MWQIAEKQASLAEDVDRCLAVINQNSDFFEPNKPIYLARAPGRLDLMGGIADYSGSLVLQLPLAVATFVAAQATDEPVISVASPGALAISGDERVDLPLSEIAPGGRAQSYREIHDLLAAGPRQQWAAYVAGALVVLQREEGVRLGRGMRLLVYSEVPIGKGVGSSAALEVAAMQAACNVLGLRLGGRRLALLCQKLENEVVGAPCGVMDQMTSACGEAGQLLALLCQPAAILPGVRLPPELQVWGIDSGVRHEVSGGDYESVRVGAFMGYRIIADLAGLPVRQAGPSRVQIDDPLRNGYLCNIDPPAWETNFSEGVPETLTGDEFLRRYSGTTDPVTTIRLDRLYQVRRPTAHPIYENYRVGIFKTLLERSPLDEDTARLLGELMYQSHASYSVCGLGSAGTDLIVEMVREAGPSKGLYGAKITGGGSGGTVAVLAHRGAGSLVRDIARRYSAETGQQDLAVLIGSSPGAVQFGVLTVRHD